MKIDILSIGQKMATWVAAGFEEYSKRMPPECLVSLVEIPAAKRTKNNNIANIKRTEWLAIQKIMNKKNYTTIIALDEHGIQWSTKTLSEDLKKWQTKGGNVVLMIGGADGLDNDCLQNAHHVRSLSKMTFPHQLVRVVFAEQIYRAWSLLINHPYHRE